MIITQNYEEIHGNSEELMHYGVKGMRWGVRRASRSLTKATTAEGRDKAVATLNKHREKASAEITKLEKKRPKLEKRVEQNIVKNDTKAAKLYEKAAYKRNKAYGRFTSQSKAEKRIFEANKLEAKADVLKSRSEKAKAALAKNETMTKAFKQGIKDIDQTLVNNGRRYING